MNNVKHLEKPRVISFLQEKGGAGKTTISTNVSRGLRLRGYKVLLVDSDPQGSTRDWNESNQGSLVPVVGLDRETLHVDIKALMSDYDFVVIDGAPQLSKMSASAIKCSDIILIPVQPSPYDIWASLDLVELIKSRQGITNGSPSAAFIISRVIKNTKLSKEINETLTEYGIPVFDSFTSQLVAYPTSASDGKSVYENPVWVPAMTEIENIIDEILRRYIDVKS
jgi:chromosome partitioning protein